MKKKLKVAIVTIISNNYGNRLQNYALQTVLQQQGIYVETMPVEKKYNIKGRIKLELKTLASFFIPKYADVCWGRFDQNIRWGKYTAKTENVDAKYDAFVAGSDQIWNPVFECNSDREFLPFAGNKKRIAYAASIGLDELPSNQCDRYRGYITKFNAVSVREKTAADIIERLGYARPKVVLDPTMLLSVEQWQNIINQSKVKYKKKYAVAYFLGVRTEAYDTYIQKMAKKMNAELIDIMRLSPNEKSKIGPAEFVWLLYHSEAVFTDSFHGTVFSILFHKPFIVFERPDEKGYGKMSSRLDTLLDTFDLNKQRVQSEEQLELVKMKWDVLRIDENIKGKREYSIEFLKKALNG